MELFLTIVGTIVSILLSGPVLTAILRRYRELKNRRRWSADLQVEKGVIEGINQYAYEFWKHTIEVDCEGAAVHTIDSRLINISHTLLKDIIFVIYADTKEVPESIISPWAKSRGIRHKVFLEDWIPKRARGRIRVLLNRPVAPGERLRLRWGYTLPSTFVPGDEYYNWDISSPQYESCAELKFASCWSILYARWGTKMPRAQPNPIVEGKSIKWCVRFPEQCKRIIVEFGLSKDPIRKDTIGRQR